MIPGMIGFATNRRSLVSKAICWVTGSRWSHVFLILDVTPTYTFVLEANEGGTDIRTWEEYSDSTTEPTELYEPILSSGDLVYAPELAVERTRARFEGVGYGYMELIGITIKILLARCHLRWHDPIHQGAICSQVAWDYVQQLFPREFAALDQHSVTPADLYEIVSKSPNWRRA
jgi:hypothetical protein